MKSSCRACLHAMSGVCVGGGGADVGACCSVSATDPTVAQHVHMPCQVRCIRGGLLQCYSLGHLSR
jgi:hypothetical protein